MGATRGRLDNQNINKKASTQRVDVDRMLALTLTTIAHLPQNVAVDYVVTAAAIRLQLQNSMDDRLVKIS